MKGPPTWAEPLSTQFASTPAHWGAIFSSLWASDARGRWIERTSKSASAVMISLPIIPYMPLYLGGGLFSPMDGDELEEKDKARGRTSGRMLFLVAGVRVCCGAARRGCDICSMPESDHLIASANPWIRPTYFLFQPLNAVICVYRNTFHSDFNPLCNLSSYNWSVLIQTYSLWVDNGLNFNPREAAKKFYF